jgi:hypothetical protein
VRGSSKSQSRPAVVEFLFSCGVFVLVIITTTVFPPAGASSLGSSALFSPTPAGSSSSVFYPRAWSWPVKNWRDTVEEIHSRMGGMLIRSMSKIELESMASILDSDAESARSIGSGLLKRPSSEVERVVSGIKMVGSDGITNSTRRDIASKTLPILISWKSANPPSLLLATAFAIFICTASPLLVFLCLPRSRLPVSQIDLGAMVPVSVLGVAISHLLTLLGHKGQPLELTALSLLVLSAAAIPILSGIRPRTSVERGQLAEKMKRLMFAMLVSLVSAFTILSVIPLVAGGFALVVLFYGSSAALCVLLEKKFPPPTSGLRNCIPCLLLYFSWSASALLVLSSTDSLSGELNLPLKSTANNLGMEFWITISFVSAASALLVFIGKLAQNGMMRISLDPVDDHHQPPHLPVLVSVLLFSLLASFFWWLSPPPPPKLNKTSTPVSWNVAREASSSGSGIIVDARPPGTHPPIPSDAVLDPDSSDEALRDFCLFASSRRVFVFCASSVCDISAELSARLSEFCPGGAAYIEGGAETWSQ